MQINLPANMTAQLAIPRLTKENSRVILDGFYSIVVPAGDFLVVDGIGSGIHTICHHI